MRLICRRPKEKKKHFSKLPIGKILIYKFSYTNSITYHYCLLLKFDQQITKKKNNKILHNVTW